MEISYIKDNNTKIALFIDAENIGANYAKFIFDEALKYGEISIKRIYGDWTKPQLKKWKEAIEEHSIKAMQCFSFASGKNSSDMFLITDVLEILYEKDIQIFIIISSDSDYSPLVQKLREKDKRTLGFGMRRTSIKSYVNSFDEFVYLDQEQKQSKTLEKELERYLIDIIDKLIEIKGKAEYAQIGIEIKRKYPDFLPQNYGCHNFRTLIKNKFLSKSSKYEENNEKKSFYLQYKD